MVVDELAAVVGVDAEHPEGELGLELDHLRAVGHDRLRGRRGA
ncbi:MAG: hypothetical protein ACR2FP_09600 [Nocardioidaceae bacterium]